MIPAYIVGHRFLFWDDKTMNPQERDLIESVFDRLGRLAGGAKDREAETLINERMRAVPDSAYNLVEAVVVQEMAIKERDQRIHELEGQLAQQQQQQQQGGGFGRPGGVFGRGSVPSTQPYSQPQQYAPPPQYAQPQPQYAQPSPWGGQPGGGGFLRGAAQTAVGVAGGVLLAEGISSMFAGGHRGGSPWGGGQPASETTINNYYGDSGQGVSGNDAPQPTYDTNVADDGGYGDFDPGYDVGGDDSF